MSCIYKYKGQTIGNVEQLNDFLLDKLIYESRLGDMVFQQSGRVNFTQNKIKEAQEHVKSLEAKYKGIKEEAKFVLDGEEYIKYNKPFIGVSEFLSGQRNENGDLYFPEFIENEYWSRRYKQWADGIYTDDEIELFFEGDKDKVTKIPLGNEREWKNSEGEFRENFGSDEQRAFRKMMETKWQEQAKWGTSIHDVLQLAFSTIKKDGPNKNQPWIRVIRNNPSMRTLLVSNIKAAASFKHKNDTSYKELSDKHINETIDYAIKLSEEIENRFGEECIYYPEISLASNLNKVYQGRDDLQLLGRIDLLVIDKNGYPQVIDYKTSPKLYKDYATAKLLGFTYQLGTYERMLRRWGINTANTDVLVAPIQMKGFRKEGDEWVFDSVERAFEKLHRGSGEEADQPALASLSDRLTKDWLNNNMNEYMEAPLVVEASALEVISKVRKIMEKWFPMYGNNRDKTDDEVRKIINDLLGDKWLDPATNSYHFTFKGSGNTIEVVNKGPQSEVEFFNKVKSSFQNYNDYMVKRTANIVTALKEGINQNTTDINIDDAWLRSRLSRYCSSQWEIMDSDTSSNVQDIAEQFGLIFLRNKITDTIDIVKISSGDSKYVYDWGGKHHTNLIGAHEVDDYENARSDSLMLKAAKGNIELMEAMAVLNNLRFSGEVKIGKMSVLSTGGYSSNTNGLEASNKELLYCWNKLCRIAPIEEENLLNQRTGTVKFLTKVEQLESEFKYILSEVANKGNSTMVSKFSKLKPISTALTNLVSPGSFNVQEAIDLVHELRKALEDNAFGMKRDLDANGKSIHVSEDDYDSQYAKVLYQYMTQALLELNGLDYRLELKPEAKYQKNIKILTEGVHGSFMDNAGNFGNRLLNQVTGLALDGVQTAREMAYAKLRTLRDKTESLKRVSGYNGVIEYTIGNLTSLYDGMTYYHLNGDLLFKNPWDTSDPEVMAMSEEKREYLKWVLIQINKNRFPKTEDFSKEASTSEYFQVPLVSASFASKVNTDGWLGWLKNRFRVFRDAEGKISATSIKEGAKQALKDFQSEYIDDEVEKRHSDTNFEIFDTINMMNQSLGPERLKDIAKLRAKYGDGYFERDLERLLGTHIWAYATHDAFETRMPLIKALYISLGIAGNTQHENYEEVQEFVEKYVRNKINHQSIVEEEIKPLKGITSALQSAVSWMALAFSPAQFTYQTLEGIWKDCKLILTKPDGTQAFTIKNMKTAAGIVYRELFHYSDKATVPQGINAFYGINDMDAASFAENNSSNNHGIFNFFGKFAYKFSSRPDFYNRMTIFVAQMMEDGSYEAHSINENNELIYDCKKDKRFKALWDGTSKDNPEYIKAQERYYALALQLIRENARNKDGSVFKINNDGTFAPLPKAYSNKEAEAKKAIGDTMYGYYDTTKKSMMLATFIGGLMMQMRTFWSSKKNQYFAPGGIKSQGKWVYMTDPDGKELFYAEDENGNIDYEAPLKYEGEEGCSKVHVMQWKGKFEEGIMLTVYDVLKQAHFNPMNLLKAVKEKCNNEDIDPDVLQTYKANLKAFAFDIAMLIMLGLLAGFLMGWKDDLIKESKETSRVADGMAASFAQLVWKTVFNSKLDFNWFDTLTEPAQDLNPFMMLYLGKQMKAFYNTAFGDEGFYDGVVKSCSATRQLKPLFDTIVAE